MNGTTTHADEVRAVADLARTLDIVALRVKTDGSKRPDVDAWAEYQTTPPSQSAHDEMFADAEGAGILCLDGLFCYDFETGQTVDDYTQLAKSLGHGPLLARISAGYFEEAPSGGAHILVYCPERSDQSGERLASDEHRVLLLERRGKGGPFVIIAPTSGACHPSGRPYVRHLGGLDSIETITGEELDVLDAIGRMLDRTPPPPPREPPKATTSNGDLRPGEDFNTRGSWAEAFGDGWKLVKVRPDGRAFWLRPGAHTPQSGNVDTIDGVEIFYMQSSGCPDLERGGYDKFGVYTHLHHRGDWSAAAGALGQAGYGTPTKIRNERWEPFIEDAGAAYGVPDASDEPDRPLGEGNLPAPPPPPGWPKLRGEALIGLPGEVVDRIDPYTEADPAAILTTYLTIFGACVGPNPHKIVDGSRHTARIFSVLVGDTSKARKGTAQANVRAVFENAEPEWVRDRVIGGMQSGEAVVAAVADTLDPDERPPDRRCLLVEEEWARVLNVASRDGNVLSEYLRQAWDGRRMEIRTKKSTLTATGSHIGAIGHITNEELARHLTDVDVANGMANRWLFVAVRRSKLRPGGNTDTGEIVKELARKTRTALCDARRLQRVRRSPEADRLWHKLYVQWARDDLGGLRGALTARVEAQVLRLSMLYALCDGAGVIEEEHLAAATALWDYSAASVRYVFGNRLGDPDADRLLAAVAAAGPNGLDFTEQARLFKTKNAEQITLIRSRLEAKDLVVTLPQESGGRPRMVTYAASQVGKKGEEG